MKGRVLITGGSGLVGNRLTGMLLELGYEVVHLGRTKRTHNSVTTYTWNPAASQMDKKALDGVTHIVHLAGAGVADHRWTKAYKKKIHDSRILGTRLLFNTVNEVKPATLKKVIAASAIGIYGNHTELNVDEQSPAEDNFLAQVCAKWEIEAHAFEILGLATTIIRIGVVLAKESGFIKEVSNPIRKYAGAVLGSGKQYLSWIHIDDLCRIFIYGIENQPFTGIWNGVAPNPCTHHEITHKLARRLNKPILLPNVPEFALRLIFGEMSTMLLASQHVSANKLLTTKFQFEYSRIDDALQNLVP